MRLGQHVAMKPSEHEEWISLRAGEVRDGLGFVLGVHPSCLPHEMPSQVNGVTMIIVSGWSDADLPKDFYGMFRLESYE